MTNEPQSTAKPPKLGGLSRIVGVAEATDKLLRPVAYLIAGLTLLTVSFPGVLRCWELWTHHPAWYQLGTLRAGKNGVIDLYDSTGTAPAWNGGLSIDDLSKMKDVDILTSSTAVGRSDPTILSDVVYIVDKDRCLHVTEVRLGPWRPSLPGQPRSHQEVAVPASQIKPEKLEEMLRVRNCQPEVPKAKTHAGPATLPVCLRQLVWVHATKVSC